MRRGLFFLALAVPGDHPPEEIRLFHAGINPTRKGPVLFDAAAAADVMAAYSMHVKPGEEGLMFDLEHLSLDPDGPNYDPDARAWARLEVRKGPELWAVGIRWTADGTSRLERKSQRFISPAFRRDPQTKRVLEVVNVAITALPATDQLTPLVAASRGQENPMDPKMLAALIAAYGLPADADEKAVMAAIAKDQGPMLEAFEEALGDDDEDEDPAKPAGDPSKPAPAMPAGGAAPAGGAVKKVSMEYHRAAVKLARTAAGEPSAEMARELLKLRADIDANKVRDLITANRARLSPGLEKWALTQTPDALELFFKSAPVLSDVQRHIEKRKPAGEGVKLTAADREVCRLTGTDPDALLKQKQALAETGVPVVVDAPEED